MAWCESVLASKGSDQGTDESREEKEGAGTVWLRAGIVYQKAGIVPKGRNCVNSCVQRLENEARREARRQRRTDQEADEKAKRYAAMDMGMVTTSEHLQTYYACGAMT